MLYLLSVHQKQISQDEKRLRLITEDGILLANRIYYPNWPETRLTDPHEKEFIELSIKDEARRRGVRCLSYKIENNTVIATVDFLKARNEV